MTWRKIIAPPDTRNGCILSGDALSYEFERKIKKEPVIVGGQAVDRRCLEKNTNLMWTGKAAYVNGSPALNWTLTFAGFEAGRALTRTIKRDSQTANEQTVARLYFAFDAYRTFFRTGKPVVTLHANQILRLPFYQEPFAEGDTMFLTKKPRATGH